MNSGLYELINETAVSNTDNEFTHYTFFNPAKCWTLKSTQYSHFWTSYCQLAYDSVVGNIQDKLAIGERAERLMPLMTYFNFQFDYSENLSPDDYISEEFIIHIIKCLQDILEENFNLPGEGLEFTCCVLQAEDGIIEDNTISIPLRLQFPYCRMDTEFQMRIIRPKVIERFRQENFISKLPYQPINSWEDAWDTTFLNEPIPMYRSCKVPNEPDLICNSIYPRIEEGEIPGKYELIDIFKAHYHLHVIQAMITPELFDLNRYPLDEDRKDFWLPLFLSIHYCQVVTSPFETPSQNFQPVNKLNVSNNVMAPKQPEEETNMDMAEKLINFINTDRISNENYWLDIGRALYNCDPTENGRGFKLWVSFSMRGGRSFDDCIQYWDTFEIENAITVKTLAFFARKDNKKLYDQWHEAKYEPYLLKATSLTETDMALAIYWVYWLDFSCSEAKRELWYIYLSNNHRWVPCDDKIELSAKLSSDFRAIFERLRTKKSIEAERTTDEHVKSKNNELINKINKVVIKLKNGTFKNKIIKEARNYFKDDNFARYMNMNPNYMGVLNGVIETCSNEAIFREGKPEDYISICSMVRYHPEYSWKSANVKEVMKWMSQCFTDPSLCEYFWRLFASFLRSGNLEKIFPCLVGEGDNSKSMVKKILEIVFGAYCFTFTTDVFMSRTAARANQQKALARYCKIVFGQEPDSDSTFKNGIIKELTGLDRIYGSLLYDNGGNFEVLFVLILITNTLPLIPGADKAIISRFRAIPFLSRWSIDAPKDEEQQFKQKLFPVDRQFSKRLPGLAPAMLWILVQKYADYKKYGLCEPAIVSEYTHQYWEEHDIYRHFTKECIEAAIVPGTQTADNPQGVTNPNESLSVVEIYSVFKNWIRDTYPDLKLPNQSEMKSQLSIRWGKPIMDRWNGIKLKETMADINMSNFRYNDQRTH